MKEAQVDIARFAPGLEGVDANELMKSIRAWMQGKIGDGEDGEKVGVCVE